MGTRIVSGAEESQRASAVAGLIFPKSLGRLEVDRRLGRKGGRRGSYSELIFVARSVTSPPGRPDDAGAEGLRVARLSGVTS